MRTKRKAIAIIEGDHVLIRSGPLPRRMEFSELTGVRKSPTRPASIPTRLATGGLLDLGRKVRHLEHLPNLDHVAVRRRATRCPVHRLRLRLDLDRPVSADHFLRLGERSVGYLGLPAGERNARGLW